MDYIPRNTIEDQYSFEIRIDQIKQQVDRYTQTQTHTRNQSIGETNIEQFVLSFVFDSFLQKSDRHESMQQQQQKSAEQNNR